MRYAPNWDCKDRKLFGYDKLICRIFFRRFLLFPLPGVEKRLDLTEEIAFVFLRCVHPGFRHKNLLAVRAVEGVGHERAAHEVVLDLPHAAHLREVASAVLEVFELGREELAGGHERAFEHARDVLLEDFVAVGDDLVQGEGIVLDRIAVDEDVLVDRLVVGDPGEVFGRLADLVADGEVRRAAEQPDQLLEDGTLLISVGVADHAVALGRFDGVDDRRGLLLEQLGSLCGGGSAQLDDALRGRPHVVAEEEADRVDLRAHLKEEDVAVHLEQVHERGRGDVDDAEERLLLRQPGRVAAEHLAHVVAQGVLPVGFLHHDDDLASLAADARKQDAAFFASRQHQGRGQHGEEEFVRFHISNG